MNIVKYKLHFYLISLFTIFNSCEHQQPPLEPGSFFSFNQESLARLIALEMVDYDSLLVKNQPQAEVPEKTISRIELGEKDTGRFVASETVVPDYESKDNSYLINFNLSRKITNKRLRAYFFTLRFFFENNTYTDIDTFVLTYKFPYKSTELFLKTNEFPTSEPIKIQDFELTSSKLYFYNLGYTRFFEYDLNSGKLREILGIGSGDHVAGNNDYIFLDFQHYSIHRFNIKKDTVDLRFDLSFLNNPLILGMDMESDTLFVMFAGTDPSESNLARFDVNGNFFYEQTLPFSSIYLSVVNHILYSVDYENNQIIRYDLNTQSLLPGKPFPAESIDGIGIYDNWLYFFDFYKEVIARVDLNEFEKFVPFTKIKFTGKPLVHDTGESNP